MFFIYVLYCDTMLFFFISLFWNVLEDLNQVALQYLSVFISISCDANVHRGYRS